MGKLIVLEGVDCSGKSTQFRMLCEKLTADGLSFRKLTFPRYSEPSSELIKMYLGGSFGSNPSDVNPYAPSTVSLRTRRTGVASMRTAEFS